MGRYVTPQITTSNLTASYADSNSTFDGDYLTAYTANDVVYSSITYEDVVGGAAAFGGVFKRITGWTETNSVNNSTQSIAVNYDASNRVSSLTIT
tara:strand:+ start:176 stop:460 length:285 start_codon:yes stop_codon:yes gene_type:complete